MEPKIWGEMTSDEIGIMKEKGGVVLLPIGAVEQHGSHLPVDMDIHGAWEVSKEVARRLPYTIVAPPVWWGLSGQHRKFPGVLTLKPKTFYNLLMDLCNSIVNQGFKKIVLVVGHASNKPLVNLLVSQFMEDTGVPLLQLNYINFGLEKYKEIRKSKIGGEAHAGELETSLEMYLRPGQINIESADIHYIDSKRDFGISSALQDILKPAKAVIGYDLKSSFPKGVMGDPTVASEKTGETVFKVIVDSFCEIIEEYNQMK